MTNAQVTFDNWYYDFNKTYGRSITRVLQTRNRHLQQESKHLLQPNPRTEDNVTTLRLELLDLMNRIIQTKQCLIGQHESLFIRMVGEHFKFNNKTTVALGAEFQTHEHERNQLLTALHEYCQKRILDTKTML